MPAFDLLILVLQALVPMLQAFSFGCDTKLAASCVSHGIYYYIYYNIIYISYISSARHCVYIYVKLNSNHSSGIMKDGTTGFNNDVKYESIWKQIFLRLFSCLLLKNYVVDLHSNNVRELNAFISYATHCALNTPRQNSTLNVKGFIVFKTIKKEHLSVFKQLLKTKRSLCATVSHQFRCHLYSAEKEAVAMQWHPRP